MADSQITVSVGCDMEGDYCLYIQRDGRYLSEHQMDRLAPLLDDFLNSDEGQRLLPEAEDDEEDDEDEDEDSPNKCGCSGDNCKTMVTRADSYFATPCGTYCGSCMALHVKECGVCKSEFRDEFEFEDEEG